MADPFVTAAGSLMASPLAVDAVYTPTVGDPVSLRALLRQPDEVIEFGRAGVATDTTVAEILVSAVAAPVAGDTLTVGGDTYRVQGIPRRDAQRLFWLLDCYRVTA